ncbi:histidine phosphatase family protein [Paenibacillus sp. OSY-SE]|uniref:histidine phosphatase family protein n=1 Tax=Paenibacillus sp. OSY-SE TaxID=1196323 RepID=UPI00035E1904
MERRAQGQSDIPLNDVGRLQARALANRLMNEQWDFLFSSDLSRAKETADIVAGTLRRLLKRNMSIKVFGMQAMRFI